MWSPFPVDNSLVVLSSIQSECYPEIGSRKKATQIIYMTVNGIYVKDVHIVNWLIYICYIIVSEMLCCNGILMLILCYWYYWFYTYDSSSKKV